MISNFLINFPFLSAPYCVLIRLVVGKSELFYFPVQPFQNEQRQNNTGQQNYDTN